MVNPDYSKKLLFEDWTAAHEFSHLLTPFMPDDRWLSEGFASYHQNISRLRMGILDEKSAWGNILAGFERGKKSAAQPNAPILKNASRKHNMQMYWGGAVLALKADVELRKLSKGKMSLSLALDGLRHCCLNTGRSWTAKQLFIELDKITSSRVFMSLYQQEVKAKRFPEFESLINDLGVKKSETNQVMINNQAPLAHIRKFISND